MIKIHDRDLRGKTKIGWLNSAHSFSFGSFQDPTRMGFKSLRVVNDDHVISGAGFAPHSHRNMEIISYVLDGALEHKDSTGTAGVIHPGDIQRMSAGSGIEHSEFNHSNDNDVHFLQIWIQPDEMNIEPSYEQKSMDIAQGFTLVGDRHGTEGAVTIHQDVRMLVAKPNAGMEVSYSFDAGRGGFLQLARGQIVLNGELLKEGDGAEIKDVPNISIKAELESEIILFDLA